METRTINGRPATDRGGAAEITGLSRQTIKLYASPTNSAAVGFPTKLDTEDGREWYALDDLRTYAETLRAKNAAKGAPDWLRNGHPDDDVPAHPDDLLPATVFRKAAGIEQGTWKRYVQSSKPYWDDGQDDGYLPLPDEEEDYRGTGKIYYWKRHRIITWLDNRPGPTAAGVVGRKPGPPAATVEDALNAIQTADGAMTGTQLAEGLSIPLHTAYRLLKKARERLDAQQ